MDAVTVEVLPNGVSLSQHILSKVKAAKKEVRQSRQWMLVQPLYQPIANWVPVATTWVIYKCNLDVNLIAVSFVLCSSLYVLFGIACGECNRYQSMRGVSNLHACNSNWCLLTQCSVQLGEYTNISIYRNTDNRNIISIHPITVSIYRNIDISQYIGLF